MNDLAEQDPPAVPRRRDPSAPPMPSASPEQSAPPAPPKPSAPMEEAAPPMDVSERLGLVQWHLERYDRLRASTAGRASVVLSASAILSAGNALVLSQVLGGGFDQYNRWVVVVFTLLALGSVATVVLALVRAGGVLVTRVESRRMFDDGALPVSLVFNGTDTVERLPTFEAFRSALGAQGTPEALAAAQVELWIGIQQHRYRYVRLRGAVRLLRSAAAAFLLLMVLGVAVNIAGRF